MCVDFVFIEIKLLICLRKWDAENSLGLWDTDGIPSSAEKTGPILIHKQRRTGYLIGFTIRAEHSKK